VQAALKQQQIPVKPCFIVVQPLAAMQQLAPIIKEAACALQNRCNRQHGKTTTKELIGLILNQSAAAYTMKWNLNSIGLPFSIQNQTCA
jgi:UDP-N-acetylmuramyl pentapeptide synthase